MKKLFLKILWLCVQAGIVRANKVNYDGTKMRANAALTADRTEKALLEEIARMLPQSLIATERIERML